MNPEQLKSELKAKSQEEARRRALEEKARELEAVQQSIHNDFKKLFESLLSEEERQKREEFKSMTISAVPPSERPKKQSDLNIVIDNDFIDQELGQGTIKARVTAMKGYIDAHARADDYDKSDCFVVSYSFTPNEADAEHQRYEIEPEYFPNGQVGEHKQISPWYTYRDLSLSAAEKLVEKMEEQIHNPELNLRAKADETLDLLLEAAANPALNPEYAERLRQQGEQEELSEES